MFRADQPIISPFEPKTKPRDEIDRRVPQVSGDDRVAHFKVGSAPQGQTAQCARAGKQRDGMKLRNIDNSANERFY